MATVTVLAVSLSYRCVQLCPCFRLMTGLAALVWLNRRLGRGCLAMTGLALATGQRRMIAVTQ